eukprot:gene32015-16536_t
MSISVGTAQTICRALPWVVLSLLLFHCSASTEEECSALIDSYKSEHQKEASPYTGDNLIFFLHVPRTAGRTFHSCMLKPAIPPVKRCPKAYDNLARIDTAVPNCGLLSSHDDFSIISKLPDDVAVLTHIRDPVDRFLSAYEFAVEVASKHALRRPGFQNKPHAMITDEVWPWSYLVPFFQKDIESRRASMENEKPNPDHWTFVNHPDGEEFFYNKAHHRSKWILSEAEEDNVLPSLDPYNNRLYMPLHEFMETDIAHELLHNGETYQVLGITNYSHWNDAEELRHCMTSYPSAMEAMFNISKARIQRFHHVGVTNRLLESATAAAASFAFPLSGPAYADQKPPRDGDKKLSEDRFSTGGPTKTNSPEQKELLEKVRLVRAA